MNVTVNNDDLTSMLNYMPALGSMPASLRSAVCRVIAASEKARKNGKGGTFAWLIPREYEFHGGKIDDIKALRSIVGGLGLKEAKDAVESEGPVNIAAIADKIDQLAMEKLVREQNNGMAQIRIVFAKNAREAKAAA